MTRIAVLVSGGGTNLQALIDAQLAGKIPHGEIVLVVASREDAYALERAKHHGIESCVVKRKEFATLEEYDGDKVIEAYPQRIINIHPSLIPSFCGKGYYGLKVHEAALAKGVKVTGATVHYVNAIPDGGEIIYQKAVEVEEGDTPEILQKRVMEQAEWILLPKAAEMLAERIEKEKTK